MKSQPITPSRPVAFSPHHFPKTKSRSAAVDADSLLVVVPTCAPRALLHVGRCACRIDCGHSATREEHAMRVLPPQGFQRGAPLWHTTLEQGRMCYACLSLTRQPTPPAALGWRGRSTKREAGCQPDSHFGLGRRGQAYGSYGGAYAVCLVRLHAGVM